MVSSLSLRDLTLFGTLKIFPKLTHVIGFPAIFAIHGIVGIAGCFVVLFFLPETRGKTMAEIEHLFNSENKAKAAEAVEAAEEVVARPEMPQIQISVINLDQWKQKEMPDLPRAEDIPAIKSQVIVINSEQEFKEEA